MSDKEKRVITWKDADQNLCTLAAYVLHQSMQELRHSQAPIDSWTYPLTDGTRIGPHFGCEENRTIFSVESSILRDGADGYVILPSPAAYYITPQCWWSFQNLIRMKLKEARKQLQENLFGSVPQKRAKTEINASRNSSKRSGSKFGRQEERE